MVGDKNFEVQSTKLSVGDAFRADIYRARKAQEAINAFRGAMPVVTRQRMARNLGSIIDQAKEHGVHKGDIVVKAGVRPCTDKERAVNALNSYCILLNSKRKAAPRLTARPQNYLKLALAAAELMGMRWYQAVLELVEGTNKFGGETELTEEAFSPAESILKSLKMRLEYLSIKYNLPDYFQAAQEHSALYGLDRVTLEYGWTHDPNSQAAITHWPTVCLTSIVRAAAKATVAVDGTDEELDGEILVVDVVSLTLGWDLRSRVVAWLEFQPALVANLFVQHPDAPWTEFDNSTYCKYFEVQPRGKIGIFRYEFAEGEKLAFIIEHDGKKWPDGASPTRARFERLTPASLAQTFIGTRALTARDQSLSPDIDTTDMIAPPSSPLAWLEAVLLGRESKGGKAATFLYSLEEDIKRFTTSFREWKAASVRRALKDHERMRADTLLAIEKLQAESLREDEKGI